VHSILKLTVYTSELFAHENHSCSYLTFGSSESSAVCKTFNCHNLTAHISQS